MRILFYFLLHLDLFALEIKRSNPDLHSCTLCHISDSSFLIGKSTILQRWIQNKKPEEQPGHGFFAPETIENVLKFSTAWLHPLSSPPSFYEKLDLISKAPLPLSTVDQERLRLLTNQAQSEVPVLTRVLDLSLPPTAKTTEEQSVYIYNLAQSLLYPYFHLHLSPGFTYTYAWRSQMRVDKILMLYEGMDIKTRGEIKIGNQFNRWQSFHGRFEFIRHQEQFVGMERGDFALGCEGQILNLSPDDGEGSPALRNMMGFMSRGQTKIVYTGKINGVKREKVVMQMDLIPQGLKWIDQEPVLAVQIRLSEKENNEPDRLRLKGEGMAEIAYNGVVREIMNKVDFRMKFFGFNLVKGRSEDRISLVKTTRTTE